MKKKNLKNLSLNKITISNLEKNQIRGGTNITKTRNDCRSCDGKCHTAAGGFTCSGTYVFCKSLALNVCNSGGIGIGDTEV